MLRRFVLWRVGLGWYLFALVGVPVLVVVSVVVMPGALESFQGLAALAAPPPLLGIFGTQSSLEDRLAKRLAGAVSRCPGCSRCTVLWSEA